MSVVYLGLGSNLGDRHRNLVRAVELLAEHLTIRAASSIYETEPVGFTEQPRFLNAVISAATSATPHQVLAWAQQAEAALGRERTLRWGPRIIDVDVLLYDAVVMDTPDLVAPHPRLAERAFVVIPLAELAPGLLHPVLGRTMAELAGALAGQGVTLVEGPTWWPGASGLA